MLKARTHSSLAFALVGLALVGCQGAQGGAEATGTGVLLLDQDARAAGFAIERDGSRTAPVLPVELGDDDVTLVGPAGRMVLSGASGELLHVRGTQGKIESRDIGEDVEPDVVIVRGTEDAANELAAGLSGKVAQTADGSWQIDAQDALEAAARMPVPEGLLSLIPADKAASLDEQLQNGAIADLQAAAAASRASRRGSVGTFDDVLTRMQSYGLPAAVECRDPVAGTWMSQDYDSRYGDWYVFTLHVDRVLGSPTDLVGQIETHEWDGGPLDSQPTACEGGEKGLGHWTVKMTATGSYDGASLRFGGTSWHLDHVVCGRALGPHDYNLDQFSGTLDKTGFRALNNDGGRMIDQPTPFRRISCQ